MKSHPTDTTSSQIKLLAEYFRQFRINSGYTQQEVAEDLDIHRKTIQNLESGKNVTLKTAFEIAFQIGMDLLPELYDEIK